MPVFEYVGIDAKGKQTKGIIDAENDRAARGKLRKINVFPTSIGLQGAMTQKMSLGMNVDFSQYFQRVGIKDIALMTRQLSALLAANIQLVDALTALIEQIDNVKLKTVLTQVRDKVTEGTKMSDAMRGHPKIFTDIYVNMVSAGENSGALDIVMQRLADFTESQARLKSKVISAMIYPLIMSIVGMILVLLLVTYVVPKVTKIFEDMDATLPLPTQFLMFVSGVLSNYWWALAIAVAGIVYVVRRYLRTTRGREWWDQKKLNFPIFGNVNRMVAVSRFSRTLATLLASGVPLLAALDIVRNIVDNSVLKKVLEETRDSVKEGQSVSEPLRRSKQFPPLVTHMIGIGEKTGELEKMLERVAATYDNEVENALSALTTLLEPLMILVMAGVVSFIVLSILLPILKLNQLGT
ncbi:MAG: type II secretion system inner membrane protein GspF [Deltaproteobacteria bacterium]|nr:type II secretion system inner membrane protein GspF [Deltaproteobacteria bacterium]